MFPRKKQSKPLKKKTSKRIYFPHIFLTIGVCLHICFFHIFCPLCATTPPQWASPIDFFQNEYDLISTEGNCPSGEYLYENLGKFIEIFREAHHRVPIIIMPFMESGAERLISKKGADRREKREAQTRLVTERTSQGDENIYLYLRDNEPEFFKGKPVSPDRVVDGLHQTDYGYIETAKGLYKMLKNLL